MCIGEHGHNKYSCCFGCPIIVGVVMVFAFCIGDLIAAITLEDIWGIVVYGILSCWFVISFIRHKCNRTRRSLYHSYLISFIITLVYLFWWIFWSG